MADLAQKIADAVLPMLWIGDDEADSRTRVEQAIRQALAGQVVAVARQYTDGLRFHHGNGFLCMGTMRIARADFDTSPSAEYQAGVFEEICAVMNAHPAPSADRVAALESQLAACREAAAEVVRISDRKHDAWDKLKAALSAGEKE